MGALYRIFSALIAIIGVLSAIKTLAPVEITYVDFFKSTLFLSGWGVCVLLAIMMIYQESKNRQHKFKDELILSQVKETLDYLKVELRQTNINFSYIASKFNIVESPKSRIDEQGEDNDF